MRNLHFHLESSLHTIDGVVEREVLQPETTKRSEQSNKQSTKKAAKINKKGKRVD